MSDNGTTWDVVVVGCGIAGLAAAVAAQQGGARVVVLERAPFDERGGNTRYTGAWMRMKNVDEVSDDFIEHFAANAGGYLDPSMVHLTSRDREHWLRNAMRVRGWPVGVCTGVALFASAPADERQALAFADGPMYRAKKIGRNRLVHDTYSTGREAARSTRWPLRTSRHQARFNGTYDPRTG